MYSHDGMYMSCINYSYKYVHVKYTDLYVLVVCRLST